MESLIVPSDVVLIVVGWKFIFAEDAIATSGALDILLFTVIIVAINRLEGLQLRVAPSNHQTHANE